MVCSPSKTMIGWRSRIPSPRFARLGLVVCNAFHVLTPPWHSSRSRWTSLRRGRMSLGGGLVTACVRCAAEQGGGRHVATLRARHICRRSLARRSDACKSSPPLLRSDSEHMHAISSLLRSIALAKEPCPALRSQPSLSPCTAAPLTTAVTNPWDGSILPLLRYVHRLRLCVYICEQECLRL